MPLVEAANIQQFLIITATISKSYLSEHSHKVQAVEDFGLWNIRSSWAALLWKRERQLKHTNTAHTFARIFPCFHYLSSNAESAEA